MFGFFTIVAIVVAWNGGGWWWLFAIVMVLAWFGQQAQEKEIKNTASQPAGDPTSNPTVKEQGVESKQAESKQAERRRDVSDWVTELTELCAGYSGADYYVAELIPQNKLESAMKFYPVPNGGRIIALVDATLMGSAKNGLAIGEHGFSWHSGLISNSSKTSFRWDEMRNISIEKDGPFAIKIGDGNKFDASGCQFGKDNIISLLRDLATLAERVGHPANVARDRRPIATEMELVDVNVADFDHLISLPGIGAAEAKMILDRRAPRPFTSADDLADFLDLKPHKVEQLKNKLVFAKRHSISPAATGSPSSPVTSPTDHRSVASPHTPTPSRPARAGRVID